MTTRTQASGAAKRATARAEEQSRTREAVAALAVELEALRLMTVGELHTEFLRWFGEPSHSRNKAYLVKKVAWRIQEHAEGGLGIKARDRIQQLLEGETTVRFRAFQGRVASLASPAALPTTPPPPPVLEVGADVDRRLPPPGTVLRKQYQDEMHEVIVREKGFEYRGQHFTSLSTLAKVITGTAWNGFTFFGLAARAPAGRTTTKGKRA